MRKFFFTFLVVCFSVQALALSTDCQKYTIHCECFSAVPLEGFKLHVVEKCDQEEEWSTDYYAPVFETEKECQQAVSTDPVCKSLH